MAKEIKQHESKGGSLLGTILDFGRELIMAGADVWKVEDTLAELCDAYAFKNYYLWVNSGCVEATVQTNDGRVYTQIRDVRGKKLDVERLTRLENLAEEVIRRRMGAKMFRDRVQEILDSPGHPWYVKYIGSFMAAAGFAAFFDGDPADVAVTGIIGLILAAISDTLGRRENNPLIYNSIASFVMEVAVLCSVYIGLAHHSEIIGSAALLLLISGLGVMNGIKELLHANTISGLSGILTAFLGAAGLAIGISLTLYFTRGALWNALNAQSPVSNKVLQTVFCTIGSVGFALLLGAKGRTVLLSGIGAAGTWIVYLLVNDFMDGNYFAAALAAACYVAFYSNAVSKVRGIPSSVFLITAIFPLVPGSYLYRAVVAAILDEVDVQHSQVRHLLLVCLAISLGYILMEVLYKYWRKLKTKIAGIA
ncbi:MAG: threonine/serine exporter family protein [Mogibacterium sp.]|nr:threonine/serine exporter family protein [Mogibacterium sp.]